VQLGVGGAVAQRLAAAGITVVIAEEQLRRLPFQTFHRYAQFKSFQSLAELRHGNLLRAIRFNHIAVLRCDANFFLTCPQFYVSNGASRWNGLSVLNSMRAMLPRQPSVAYAGKFTVNEPVATENWGAKYTTECLAPVSVNTFVSLSSRSLNIRMIVAGFDF